MAVNGNDRRRTAYRESIYVQGNTARKLQALPAYEPQQPQKKISNRTRKNRERALHMNVATVLSMAVAMVAAGLILTVYMTLQSDITNSIKHLSLIHI